MELNVGNRHGAAGKESRGPGCDPERYQEAGTQFNHTAQAKLGSERCDRAAEHPKELLSPVCGEEQATHNSQCQKCVRGETFQLAERRHVPEIYHF